MDARTDEAAEPSPAVAEPRQRWRVTFARAVPTDDSPASGRDYLALWEAALLASGLPLATTDTGRPKLTLAVPLPTGASGRGELLDFWLTERLEAWRVRECVTASPPDGHEILSVEDVWLGAPALSGRVAAAEYRVALRRDADPAAVKAAAAALLEAASLPRERMKGGGVKTYDLRPLLMTVSVEDGEEITTLFIRTRIHPELGSGRPEEVVAALSDRIGAPLEVTEIVRECLILTDELDPA